MGASQRKIDIQDGYFAEIFEIRLDLELTLDHPPLTPPIKGGGTKESQLISMFPLPSWERARVRGK